MFISVTESWYRLGFVMARTINAFSSGTEFPHEAETWIPFQQCRYFACVSRTTIKERQRRREISTKQNHQKKLFGGSQSYSNQRTLKLIFHFLA
jgi:hypothetical protein